MSNNFSCISSVLFINNNLSLNFVYGLDLQFETFTENMTGYRVKLTKLDLSLSCIEMANFLLGKILVRKCEDNTIIKGKIVETECYLGGTDKASHSFNGRQTPRNEPMFMAAGTAYVYMTYGMYHCFNISSKEPGAAVLLRALQPMEGIECMQKHRLKKLKKTDTTFKLKPTDLCNGPSKLCISMDIRKDNINKVDLCQNDFIWLEWPEENESFNVIKSTRIGIASAGEEWASKPLRFYIFGNPHVSKRDRKTEKNMEFPT